MIIYILKFSGCLLAFIAFYKLFLERESFHRLKRVYLLGALFLSLTIPFITFTEYVETTPIIDSVYTTYDTSDAVFQETIIETSWKDYLPNIIWSIYFIGLLVFSFRFVKHLYQMYYRIMNNEKLKDKAFTNVLLLDKINPHTFFKYIFLNKHKYESNAIPKEVMLHEQTHAKELHALDIIIIELIQVLFWFNPLLYFIKKDIKLNHEFLADQSVLKVGTEPINYQQLLLAFSSNACEPQLANAINYSSIKKRLSVMKTQTTKSKTWIKSLLLLPLLSVLVYGFSSEKVEYLYSETNHTARSISIEILENDLYSIDGIKANKKSFIDVVNKLHQDISPEVRNRIMNIHVSSSNKITDEETWFIYNALLNYGFHRMVTPDQEIVLSKGNTPFAIDNKSTNNGIELYLNSEGELFYNNEKIKIEELASIQNLADDLAISIETTLETDIEVTKGVTKSIQEYLRNQGVKGFSVCVSATEIDLNDPIEKIKYELKEAGAYKINYTNKQEIASREQMKAYNTWAKKMNAQIELAKKTKNSSASKSYPIIKLKDVEKYKYIYSIMSDKQRKDVEPFPNLPEAPPPPPKAPLDHIIDMAKKNAVFYLEGKKVSSDKAINALKKNKKLNISTKNSNTKQPEVYITKKGVTIKKNINSKQGNKKTTYNLKSAKLTNDNLSNETKQDTVFYKKNVSYNENSTVLDEVKKLINNKATFYYQDKTLPYKSVLELFKNNANLMLETKTSKNDKSQKIYIQDKNAFFKKIKYNPNKKTDSLKSPSTKTGSIDTETGNININGEKHFYSKRNGITSYFNTSGQQVDKNGKRITNSEIKNPIFYYNGEQISSNKANALLNSNRNIAVTNESYEDGRYALVLSKVNSNTNYNNINHNVNKNVNTNPNSVIDFTDLIKKGAIFSLDGNGISTEEAINLTKINSSIHVQVLNYKNAPPRVMISMKPKINNSTVLAGVTADNIVNHIRTMSKKNAKFYLDNTRISFSEALKYVKENRDADVSTSTESNVVIIKKNNQTPKTGFINANGEKLFYTVINTKTTYYNRYGVITDKNGKELKPNEQTNASDVLPNSHITKVFKNDQIVSEFKNTASDLYVPRPPKDIPSMLQLANKGAIFYYEGEQISGKTAINLTDNYKDLNILIKDIDSKKPIVKLSIEPIRI